MEATAPYASSPDSDHKRSPLLPAPPRPFLPHRSTSRLKPTCPIHCTRSNFVHHPSSFSYKRMLPFRRENGGQTQKIVWR